MKVSETVKSHYRHCEICCQAKQKQRMCTGSYKSSESVPASFNGSIGELRLELFVFCGQTIHKTVPMSIDKARKHTTAWVTCPGIRKRHYRILSPLQPSCQADLNRGRSPTPSGFASLVPYTWPGFCFPVSPVTREYKPRNIRDLTRLYCRC